MNDLSKRDFINDSSREMLLYFVRFQDFTAAIVFWDVLPCSQVNVDRRFRGE
jgi:hypothetical protein